MRHADGDRVVLDRRKLGAMKRTRTRHLYSLDFRALEGQDPKHTHFCGCGFTGTRDDCDAHLLMKLYDTAVRTSGEPTDG